MKIACKRTQSATLPYIKKSANIKEKFVLEKHEQFEKKAKIRGSYEKC